MRWGEFSEYFMTEGDLRGRLRHTECACYEKCPGAAFSYDADSGAKYRGLGVVGQWAGLVGFLFGGGGFFGSGGGWFGWRGGVVGFVDDFEAEGFDVFFVFFESVQFMG